MKLFALIIATILIVNVRAGYRKHQYRQRQPNKSTKYDKYDSYSNNNDEAQNSAYYETPKPAPYRKANSAQKQKYESSSYTTQAQGYDSGSYSTKAPGYESGPYSAQKPKYASSSYTTQAQGYEAPSSSYTFKKPSYKNRRSSY